MTARVLIPAIAVVAVLASCLEGRYHLEETGLRHHRHDRHHQTWDDDDLDSPRGRDWDSVSPSRRNPYERRDAPVSYRGRHEPQRKWRTRPENRRGRDYAASSWRNGFEDGLKSRRRSERPWTYRNPSRYSRRRWGWYDDEDDGYETDDENEAYAPPRKQARRHRYEERRRRIEEEQYDDEEDYDSEYDDYEIEETRKRPSPSRRKHDYDEEFRTGKKIRGGKRKEAKKPREKAEDLNEVEDDEDAEDDDVWDNEEDDDDYDETDTPDVGKSSLKTIDDVIRRLSGVDVTTVKPNARRDYRDIDVDKQAKSGLVSKVEAARSGAKKLTTTTTTTTTTTGKPESYAKYTSELSRATNSSKNEVETEKKKGAQKVTVDEKSMMTKLTETETDVKMKSLEQQDYEEYENDDNKDQDYNEEENADESENDDEIDQGAPTTTTTPLPTTTTTSTTTTPSPISTRSFDRHSRLTDARVAPWKNPPAASTTSTAYPPMSNYSASKWKEMGSRASLNERRRSRIDDNNEIRQAIIHARKMSREAACRWPKPKVIPVHDVYTSPSKLYNPSCTILHRCADDTGCCRPTESCVPKSSHNVSLSFYTTELGSNSIVEKLIFVNHTECYCRPRSEIRTTPRPTLPPKPCKCPMNFMAKVSRDGSCQCACAENNIHCTRQRRGKDQFLHADRWCIQYGDCTLPPCEFGAYIKKHGQCPKKLDRMKTLPS